MRKTAIIDIDNTLWQFCDAFYLELKKINTNFPTPDQWSLFNFYEGYCSDKEFFEAINAIHAKQDSVQYRPYPEARSFLSSLREEGFDIIIASHRVENARQPTERWLAQHGLQHDELHLSFDKTMLFGRADVIVDDAPQTLEKAIQSGVLAAGLLFPWNRAYAGSRFGLFQDLKGVLGYILKRLG
jgi:hypothetical protein